MWQSVSLILRNDTPNQCPEPLFHLFLIIWDTALPCLPSRTNQIHPLRSLTITAKFLTTRQSENNTLINEPLIHTTFKRTNHGQSKLLVHRKTENTPSQQYHANSIQVDEVNQQLQKIITDLNSVKSKGKYNEKDGKYRRYLLVNRTEALT